MTTTWFDAMTTAVSEPYSTDVILDTIIFRGNRGGKKSCGGGRGYCGRQIMSSRKSREELRHCCNDAVRGSIVVVVVAGASIERDGCVGVGVLEGVGRCWSCCGGKRWREKIARHIFSRQKWPSSLGVSYLSFPAFEGIFYQLLPHRIQ